MEKHSYRVTYEPDDGGSKMGCGQTLVGLVTLAVIVWGIGQCHGSKSSHSTSASTAEESAESQGRSLLTVGQQFEANKLPDKAAEKYREVREKYPGTASAKEAEERLKSLGDSGKAK